MDKDWVLIWIDGNAFGWIRFRTLGEVIDYLRDKDRSLIACFYKDKVVDINRESNLTL